MKHRKHSHKKHLHRKHHSLALRHNPRMKMNPLITLALIVVGGLGLGWLIKRKMTTGKWFGMGELEAGIDWSKVRQMKTKVYVEGFSLPQDTQGNYILCSYPKDHLATLLCPTSNWVPQIFLPSIGLLGHAVKTLVISPQDYTLETSKDSLGNPVIWITVKLTTAQLQYIRK